MRRVLSATPDSPIARKLCALWAALWLVAATGAASAAKTAPVSPAAPAAGSLAFHDLKGQSYSAKDLHAAKATLFLFLSTQCPISNSYTPRILRLAADYGSRGVRLFGVDPNDDETLPALARYGQERSYAFPMVKDAGGVLARRLGARMTPEAVLLDATGRVRYRGRIDDNQDVEQVHVQDLRDAIEAVLAGKPVARASAQAFGCAIRFRISDFGFRNGRKELGLTGKSPKSEIRNPKSEIGRLVTYTRDVAPILQANCQSCHRPGEVAPFPLTSYEQARAWAGQIRNATQRRVMPPWRADPHYGQFENVRALTAAQIATLARWVDEGTPRGDARDLPPPRKFTEGWALGEPDLVLEPTEEYHLAAEGRDVYRCFVLPARFAEDRYVAAIEARPGNRAVVHHVIAYLDSTGISEQLDAADPEPGYTSTAGFPGFVPAGLLGGWVPGNTVRRLPDGVGNLMPANSRIVMEVHYHKDGKPETDRTRLGIYFAHGPVDRKLRFAPIVNMGLRIPAGASHQEVHAQWTTPRDIEAIAALPHMHLLGREIQVSATLPDGTTKPIVRVNDWDFNWQETYIFKESMKLPEGTRFDVTAYYDNSEKNPRNPNHPPKEVTWGEQTTDEMCVAFITYLLPGEHLTQSGAGVAAGPPANLGGTWMFHMSTPLGAGQTTATFRQEGEKLNGVMKSPLGEVPFAGAVRGDHVTFTMTMARGPSQIPANFDGRLAGNTLSGIWEYGTIASGKWSASRQLEAQAADGGGKKE